MAFPATTLNIDQFTEQTSINLIAVFNSSVCWGDYDNDGDLDILITGNTGSSPISKVYANNGNNSFTEQLQIQLPNLSESSAVWGDSDNDGDLDILLCGFSNSLGRVSTMFINNGDNTFSENSFTIITPVWGGSMKWGDCDNDGDLDFLLTGNSQEEGLITKLYINNGGNIFLELSSQSFTGVCYSSAALGDYDNDQDLDFIIAGYNGNIPITKIYCNNGDSTFTELSSISIIGVSGSSVEWGDYDNDGDLDILLSGKTNTNASVTKIYRNEGLNIFTEQTSINLTGISFGSAIWGDYDNDGYLDIFLTGDSGTGVSKIYKNNGNNAFTEQTSIVLTGMRSSTAAWGDYDNDGDLDLLLTGYSNNNVFTKIYKNNNLNSNSIPNSPANLITAVNGSTVTLKWDKSSDIETPRNGLTYNLVIGTLPTSVNKLSPMSNRINGFRKVIGLGNTNHDSVWTIRNFDPGKYFWSVQAIDNSFAGSNFAPEQSFSVGVSLIPEGLYDQAANCLRLKDTIKAFLRNSYAPYLIVDSAKAIIDSLNFGCFIKFQNASAGNYYLTITHRNSIETWSSSPISYNENNFINYYFPDDSSKAFGNNMSLKNGYWCIFTGDINQDKFIDIYDDLEVFNDSYLGAYRLLTDLNGDKYVDIFDDLIVFNNSYRSITAKYPGFPQFELHRGIKKSNK